MNHLKKLIFILPLFVLSFVSISPSYAFKFNIDSPRVVLEINPGEKEVGYITVDSYGFEDDLTVRVYQEDVIYLPDGTNDFLPKGSTKWSVADWVKVEPKEFLLKGNTAITVKYTVAVPPNARGGRYGVIFFEITVPTPPESADALSRSTVRMGSIVAVIVKGTADYKGELAGLKKHFDQDKNLIVSCIIRNSGNALIRPVGEFVILDKKGVEVAKKDVNPTRGGVLPNTNRTFEVKWEPNELSLAKDKDYILQVTVDYGGKSLLGGQTSLKLPND